MHTILSDQKLLFLRIAQFDCIVMNLTIVMFSKVLIYFDIKNCIKYLIERSKYFTTKIDF